LPSLPKGQPVSVSAVHTAAAGALGDPPGGMPPGADSEQGERGAAAPRAGQRDAAIVETVAQASNLASRLGGQIASIYRMESSAAWNGYRA